MLESFCYSEMIDMSIISKDAVLLIIDVQKGFDEPYWGRRNNPQAEENIQRLLQLWRETKRPIYHIQHLSPKPNHPLRPNYIGSEIKDIVKPLTNEPVIQKNVNSAFIGTDLEARLKQNGYNTLVIVGLTTDHCVSTTTRMAGNLGFKTYIVSDATATFDRKGHDGKVYKAEDIHNISLVSLHGMFATVTNTQKLIESSVM